MLRKDPLHRLQGILWDACGEVLSRGKGNIAHGCGTPILLILLNKHTFTGTAGEAVAQMIREAREANVAVLLLHEVMQCAFSWVLETTPRDLADAGLYQKIAIDFMPWMPHQQIATAMFAKDCGALELKKLRKRKAAHKTRTNAPKVQTPRATNGDGSSKSIAFAAPVGIHVGAE